MNVPKLHHYVPRFYLNRFTDQNERFWVWDKSTEKSFQTNPYGVAAQNHFYRIPEFIGTELDPLFLERNLAEVEGKAAQITQNSNVMAITSSRVSKHSPCTRSFLKPPNQLSVGALSQQLPLRLIEQIMLYSLRLACHAWL